MSPSIQITRYPYEEPYHLNLRLAATNGRVCGNLEYYCNASDLTSLSQKLAAFSGHQGDEIVYQLGSEKTEDRFAFFLSLKFRALTKRGKCVVVIRLNNNQAVPEREVTEFCIEAEVPAINRLGNLLAEFGRLEHRVLKWTLQDGELGNEDSEPT